MNRIPKSLGKPFLKDAIVELRFRPQVATNLLPGIFYERLREDGWVAPIGDTNPTIAFDFELGVGTTVEPIFVRNGFRLQVLPDRVFFNIEGAYPGWSKVYRPLLEQTLPKLLEEQQIVPTRMSLRYINDIPDPNVFELTAHFTNDPLPRFTTDNKAVRWTLQHESITVILNLASNLRGSQLEERSSVMDVDLQQPLEPGGHYTVEMLLPLIDTLHDLNKEIVFGRLLPEGFVDRFEPTY